MLARNDDEGDELDPVDRAALELAVKLTLEEKDLGRVQQVRSMLADLHRPWLEVAEFCSYHQQKRALCLGPGQLTPCGIYPDDEEFMAIRGSRVSLEAVKLLRRMLDAGVSRFHPDPMTALKEAEHPSTRGGRRRSSKEFQPNKHNPRSASSTSGR
jgi:hypothetical protein